MWAAALVVASASGCASAPAFRAQAVVLVGGRGEQAWQNAREAASALTLRQNLRRLERDVRRHRLRMLDADDPVAVLQDAVVAKRLRGGRVRVRIYGDARRELRTLCRALLALWETEGLMGRTPKTEPPRVEEEPRARRSASDQVRVARARAELEEEQRRLFGEKQRLLSEQVELGQQWQQAERRVQLLTKQSSEARSAVSQAEMELRRVRGAMQRAGDRFDAMGDADVLRLHTEVRDAEAALSKASGLPAEIRARVAQVLERKKKALELAQGRFEKEAETKLNDAKDRLTALERQLDGATRAQSDVRGKRFALESRLKQIEAGLTQSAAKVKAFSAEQDVQRPVVRRPPRRVIFEEAKVYRLREVLKPCRVYRLRDD
jgi:chromosome segregation ATPase